MRPVKLVVVVLLMLLAIAIVREFYVMRDIEVSQPTFRRGQLVHFAATREKVTILRYDYYSYGERAHKYSVRTPNYQVISVYEHELAASTPAHE